MKKTLYRITDIGWGLVVTSVLLSAVVLCYLFIILCGRDILPVIIAWNAGIRQSPPLSFYGWLFVFLLVSTPVILLAINLVSRGFMQIMAYEDEIVFHIGWRSDRPQMIRREDIISIQAMPQKFRAYFGSTGFNRRTDHRFSEWIGYSPVSSESGGLAIRTLGSKYMVSCPDPAGAAENLRTIYKIDGPPIEPPTLASERKRDRWRRFFRRSERSE